MMKFFNIRSTEKPVSLALLKCVKAVRKEKKTLKLFTRQTWFLSPGKLLQVPPHLLLLNQKNKTKQNKAQGAVSRKGEEV